MAREIKLGNLGKSLLQRAKREHAKIQALNKAADVGAVLTIGNDGGIEEALIIYYKDHETLELILAHHANDDLN